MEDRNNILLLTIDSLRTDHMNCYGYTKKVDPNIHRLASKGVFFSEAFSNGGNTYFSFPPIFTSSYALMHSLASEKGYPYNWIFLSEDRPTFVETLKKSGYSTAAIHSNPWISTFFNYHRGFDVFDDSLGKKNVKKALTLKEDALGARSTLKKISMNKYARQMGWLYKILIKAHKGGYRADEIHQKALSWLKNNQTNPFFLWLHYMDVHMPYISPKNEFFERLKSYSFFRNRNKTHSDNEIKTLIELYDKVVSYVDFEIGEFLNELEKMGISLDNTYIFLTTDHGEELMDHGFIGHGSLYDEVIRVPLIISGPDLRKNEKICEQVSHLDIAPTILELLGVDKYKEYLGNSLIKKINNEARENKAVISEIIKRSRMGDGNISSFSLRTPSWKYILNLSKEKSQSEFYDLKNDPGEKNNCVQENEKKVKAFEDVLVSHITLEEKMRKLPREKSWIRYLNTNSF